MPNAEAQQVPWRSIYWAIGLMSIGIAMFVAGLVLWSTEGNSALIALWVLGMLVFIPGFYFTRIAYKVWKGRQGFSWADIPEWTQ